MRALLAGVARLARVGLDNAFNTTFGDPRAPTTGTWRSFAFAALANADFAACQGHFGGLVLTTIILARLGLPRALRARSLSRQGRDRLAQRPDAPTRLGRSGLGGRASLSRRLRGTVPAFAVHRRKAKRRKLMQAVRSPGRRTLCYPGSRSSAPWNRHGDACALTWAGREGQRAGLHP